MRDDLVEQCAGAAYDATPFRSTEGPYEDQTEEYRRMCRLIANAVLAIARPAILEEAAQWHEKNARYCREVSHDEPRINLDARQKARIAASHHDASAVGLRHLALSEAEDEGER